MLLPRIIPCLLIHNGGLVKTVKFTDPKYVGDPLNAVRIFNEKEVDELIVVDIDASVKGKEPDYNLIAKLASECRMPLCYGGGIKNVEQVENIISLGVEKVSISSAAVDNPRLITDSAERVGNQSIVITLDVKKSGLLRKYEIYKYNGKTKTGINPVDFAEKMQKIGAGEIVINSIDHDGTMQGYNIELARQIRNVTTLPLTILGGAGTNEHLKELVDTFGIIGASAGSLFVFKGKYRAVLINYPAADEKKRISQTVLNSKIS